ncbi:MAG: type II secretion system F family protein [Polyangiaceae bacterium]|nr:type II secretion system F family protein [Polyangiaceae bacterium]
MSSGVTLFRAFSGLALCAAASCFAYAIASAPSGEPVRLGLRGLKRQRALAESLLFAQVEPLVRWLGRRLRGLITEEQTKRLDRQITLAGDYLGLVPEEVVGLAVLTATLGGVVGALGDIYSGLGGLGVMFGVGFGAIWPTMEIGSKSTERLTVTSRRLPQVIDLMALAVGAGLDFPGAIRQVVEKAGNVRDPLIEELSLLLQALQIGRTRRQALEDFAARVPCRVVIEFCGAVVQAEMRGTPVATVLAIQAEVARQHRSTNAEVAASKANVRLILPLGMIFICVLILVIAPMVLSLRGGFV